MKKDKLPSKKTISAAAKKVKAEADKNGLSFSEQLSQYAVKKAAATLKQDKGRTSIPPEIVRQLLFMTAERLGRTPGQHLKSVLCPGANDKAPKELQNWYAQLFGEFAEGRLSEIMRQVLMFAASKDETLMDNLLAAFRIGDIWFVEQVTRCVALVHGKKYDKIGHAARLASPTQRRVGLAYLRLYEVEGSAPTPREIHVLLAHEVCMRKSPESGPRFSDIWYLLRSGQGDDSQEKPSRKARYEITGTKNIKKVINAFKWPLKRSDDGPLTVDMVRTILNKSQLKFADDSGTIAKN